jgi:anti-sigma regulatory factor (Ser/Thr protein kinase)
MSEDARRQAEIEVTLAAEPESLPHARELLSNMLEDAGVEGEARRDGLLVASELITNAIGHGSRSGDEISIAYRIGGDSLCICVSDSVRGSSVPVVLTPDDQRPGGRGLRLVEELAEWSETVVDGKRQVRAKVPLPAGRD